MSNIYLGMNRGANRSPDAIASGSSTNAIGIEVRIDLSKGFMSLEVEDALAAITRKVLNEAGNLIGNV